MSSSKKHLRRLYALREADRRAREKESRNLQSAGDVCWEGCESLTPTLRHHIVRLGGLPNRADSHALVKILTRQVRWPSGKFNSSVIRFCEVHEWQLEDLSEFEFQDREPIWSLDFEFAVDGSFYKGWEQDFGATDAGIYFPFGFDSHYYFLMHENPMDPLDPLISLVDHEQVDEVPSHQAGANVTQFSPCWRHRKAYSRTC